jgi:hypothetical protein
MLQVFKADSRELFNRDGSVNTRPFALDPKGKPWTSYIGRCGRCGGRGGSEAWRYTGYTCYDCGGSGKGHVRYLKLYTCDELAKLNARKAKADATKQAKRDAAAAKAQAEADARRADFMREYGPVLARMEKHASTSEFIANVLAKVLEKASMSDKQLDAAIVSMDKADARAREKAASEFVGEVGKRIECPVTVKRCTNFSRPSFNAPWRHETVYVVTMRDEQGNALVSMSGAFSAQEGETFTIRGTVKEHSVYKGEKQTKLSRVAVK